MLYVKVESDANFLDFCAITLFLHRQVLTIMPVSTPLQDGPRDPILLIFNQFPAPHDEMLLCQAVAASMIKK
jgi:hypothetical protein